MKFFASAIALISILAFPCFSFGAALPSPGDEVLIEGRVESVEWPHMEIVTGSGKSVRILMRENAYKTFLPGDEIGLYATCRGGGADCEFSAWEAEPDMPSGPLAASGQKRERPEGPGFRSAYYMARIAPPVTYDYGYIYNASGDLRYVYCPPSEPTGGYYQWSGVITAIQYSPEDKVYVAFLPDCQAGFAFTRIKKAEGHLGECAPVTVVGKYESNWVFTRPDGRKVTIPLLYYSHVRAPR